MEKLYWVIKNNWDIVWYFFKASAIFDLIAIERVPSWKTF